MTEETAKALQKFRKEICKDVCEHIDKLEPNFEKKFEKFEKKFDKKFETLELKFEKHDVKKDFYYHIKGHKRVNKVAGGFITVMTTGFGWIFTKLPSEFYQRILHLF